MSLIFKQINFFHIFYNPIHQTRPQLHVSRFVLFPQPENPNFPAAAFLSLDPQLAPFLQVRTHRPTYALPPNDLRAAMANCKGLPIFRSLSLASLSSSRALTLDLVGWLAAAAPGGVRSFLQAVSTVTEETRTPLRVVQMEGLVITSEPHPVCCLCLRFGIRDLRNLGVLRGRICSHRVRCIGDRNQGKVNPFLLGDKFPCSRKHSLYLNSTSTVLFVFTIMLFLQAVLKIIKHCEEFAPALVTGQLLGLDVGSVLEVTNCFPFPVSPCSLTF